MGIRLRRLWLLTLVVALCGCDRTARMESERVRLELERARAEQEKTRAEIVALQTRVEKLQQEAVSRNWVDELEKLESLKTKGLITQDVFDRQMRVILERQPVSVGSRLEGPKSGMDELATQIRTMQSLYNSSTITMQERDAKKLQLIQKPLLPIDLKKDLLMVQSLYNEGAITLQERDTLKQKLLELDTVVK